ncbi:GMC family oxidoreductase [Paraburkholderia unamae]|uniref:5-(Hydroxymethyl)furfural/furfural oxidase n=1 Tax=Paraburkholderia unamae TaxID=219649 RepID=A0ABX5KXN7_9BURK|nr:GMC family oxidoreductase N-terminal domain-containing protein [Paraburkholderia unamae]PVX85905.1 5-(hydroxymethyl)furfural/furfural oxidase [Paraburkholderia unamae]
MSMQPTGKQRANASNDEFGAFDVVIVGGGSAGCVLANRLSAEPGLRVLLIEAGRDFAPGDEPATMRDSYPRSYGQPEWFWSPLNAEVRPKETPRPFEQARVMGGGSSVMGMAALRGLPSDYNAWAAAGAVGWSWDDVLPWFRALENDLDFKDAMHGDKGPVTIRRHAPWTWPLFSSAMADVLRARGYESVADLNGSFEDGVGAVPMSNLPYRRISAAVAYLDAAVRARPNLHILAATLVERVELTGKRVSGVTVSTPQGKRFIAARHVVAAAGAIHSPALLQRSGIGEPGILQALGIPVIHALPGVGKNLQNHPLVSLAAWLKPRARQPNALRPGFSNCLRYSSNHAQCPGGDMFLVMLNKTSWHALGRSIGGIGVSVYKPFSQGDVALQSRDAQIPPRVRFNLLADERDRTRLGAGLRVALDLLAEPNVARQIDGAILPVKGKLIRDLSRPGTWNALKARAAASAFDLSPHARTKAFAAIGLDCASLRSHDDAAIADLAYERAVPTGHVAGTCRIGSASDPYAVVDTQCHVRGVEGLSVIDASVMPAVVSANTNLPVLMIAEKAAADLSATLCGRRAATAPSLHSIQGNPHVRYPTSAY